jgi:hypothetical protein
VDTVGNAWVSRGAIRGYGWQWGAKRCYYEGVYLAVLITGPTMKIFWYAVV